MTALLELGELDGLAFLQTQIKALRAGFTVEVGAESLLNENLAGGREFVFLYGAPLRSRQWMAHYSVIAL